MNGTGHESIAALPAPIRELFPFAIHSYQAPGCTLAYVDEGPRDAPVVLMVHGNPTWSFFYRSLILRLRSNFRCIVPDHAGCGLSSKPQDYDYCLATHITNLGLLIDGMGIGRAHLIVHDWGGAIGLGMARHRADFVDRLVILNTAAFPSTRIPVRIAACRLPFIGGLLVRGGNAFSRGAVHMAVRKPLPPAVRAGYFWPYRSFADRVAIHHFVQDIPMEPSHRSYPEIEAIDHSLATYAKRPVLIRWGGRDWCFDDWFLQEWRQRMPRADATVLPDAGHWLLEDEPETIGRDVESFLTAT